MDIEGHTLVADDYATNDISSATAGQDYSTVSGTLRFAPGEQTKTVQVATSADGIDEGPETLQLVLSNPVNAGLADAIGTGTINNTDAPQIRVSDLTITEGGTLEFEVKLNKTAPWNVIVPYTTADSTAVQSEDYIATADTVTIFAGETSASVPVITIDDRLDENPESLRLELRPSTGGILADGIAIGTLFDNDDPPEVSLSQVEATADENAGPMTFTIVLSELSGRAVDVAYATDDLTATAGDDYTDNDGTIDIPAGQISVSVDVEIIDDDDEGAETFRFALSSTAGYPTNARLGSITAAGGIIVDDGAAQPSVLLRNASPAVEGSPVTVDVHLDRPATQVVTLYYSTGDGTATAPDDYTAVSNELIDFALGEQDQTITVATADDSDIEENETFTVRLDSATNARLLHQSTVLSILDNDGVPEVSVDDAVAAVEGAAATFTVRLSVAVNQPVTATYEARVNPIAGDSSAIPDLDFASTSGTVTFTAGQTTQTVTVPTIQDVFDEADETFWLQLTSTVGAKIVDGTAEGLILDDDPLPILSIGDSTTVEGMPAVFTVRIDAPSGRDVTATYASTPNTSADDPATPGIDYASAPGTLRIPRGTTETTIEVETLIEDDPQAEHDEAFLVQIYNPSNSQIGDGTGEGIIFDLDGEPRLTVDNVVLFEDQGPAEFTVSLSHASSEVITVGYVTFDGTATHTDDYTFTSAALTIPDLTAIPVIPVGATSATITVPLVDDTLEENDETFRLQLTSPTNATISDQEGVAVILDDDGTPRISVGDAEALENNPGGAIDFPVTLQPRCR